MNTTLWNIKMQELKSGPRSFLLCDTAHRRYNGLLGILYLNYAAYQKSVFLMIGKKVHKNSYNIQPKF